VRTYGRKAKSSISAAAARTADPIGAAPSSSIERAVLQLRGSRALEVEGQQAAPHVRPLPERVFDLARALALARRSGGSAPLRARRSRPPLPCRVRGAPRACPRGWTWPRRAPWPSTSTCSCASTRRAAAGRRAARRRLRAASGRGGKAGGVRTRRARAGGAEALMCRIRGERIGAGDGAPCGSCSKIRRSDLRGALARCSLLD